MGLTGLTARRFGPYLSPFYSPEIFGSSPHSWFGPKPGFWPGWMPWSPAFLILWANRAMVTGVRTRSRSRNGWRISLTIQ